MLSIRAKHGTLQPWSCVASWLRETLGDGMEGSYASLVSFSVLEQACQETDAHSSTPEDEQVSDLPYWNHPCAPKTECSVPFEVNTSPHSLSWHFTVSLKLQQGVPWWPSSYDSRLSLSWPGFNPWLGNWDAASHAGAAQKKKNCNRVDLRCIASCKADKLEPLRANLLEGKQNNSRFLLHLGPLIWSYVRLKAGLTFIATSALTFIHWLYSSIFLLSKIDESPVFEDLWLRSEAPQKKVTT